MKLSVISILMERHSVILVWLIRIDDICNWWYEKDKKLWTENKALRHACEYDEDDETIFTKSKRSVRYERIQEIT